MLKLRKIDRAKFVRAKLITCSVRMVLAVYAEKGNVFERASERARKTRRKIASLSCGEILGRLLFIINYIVIILLFGIAVRRWHGTLFHLYVFPFHFHRVTRDITHYITTRMFRRYVCKKINVSACVCVFRICGRSMRFRFSLSFPSAFPFALLVFLSRRNSPVSAARI